MRFTGNNNLLIYFLYLVLLLSPMLLHLKNKLRYIVLQNMTLQIIYMTRIMSSEMNIVNIKGKGKVIKFLTILTATVVIITTVFMEVTCVLT